MNYLTGYIGQTFGGFTTIRGYAKFSDVVELSKPKEYQRSTIPEHLADITKFYEKGEAIFFPEVILSLELKFDFNKQIFNEDTSLQSMAELLISSPQTGNPIEHLLSRRNFTSNENGIKVKITQAGKATVTIPDDLKPFGRIDGNHRLSVGANTSVFSEKIPFCIVLFNEGQIDKNEKTLFFNINSKGRPLTTEETLSAILDDEVNFQDDEIQDNPSFGWEYLLARKIRKLQPNSQIARTYPNLITSFTRTTTTIKDGEEVEETKICICEFAYNLVVFLSNNNLVTKDTDIGLIDSALQEVNSVFYNYNTLKEASNSAYAITAVALFLENERLLNSYVEWVSKNQFGELNEVEPQSLYEIYKNLRSHNPKIFVAMPYFSEAEIESFNATYERTIQKLNDDFDDLNLVLLPIMNHQGASKNIINRMFEEIDSATVFIADITRSNANVSYELGYAKSKNKPAIILKQEGDESKVPFDFYVEKRNEYNPLAHSTLENTVYEDLKSIFIELGIIKEEL